MPSRHRRCATSRVRRGILNFVNYEFRYHPVRNKLHYLVRDGAAGMVEQVEWSASRASAQRVAVRRASTPRAEAGGCVPTPATPSTSSAGRSVRSWTPPEVSVPRSPSDPTARADARVHRRGRLHRDHENRPRAWITIDTTATRCRRPACAVSCRRQRRCARGAERRRARGRRRILLHTEQVTSELFRIDPGRSTTTPRCCPG